MNHRCVLAVDREALTLIHCGLLRAHPIRLLLRRAIIDGGRIVAVLLVVFPGCIFA